MLDLKKFDSQTISAYNLDKLDKLVTSPSTVHHYTSPSTSLKTPLTINEAVDFSINETISSFIYIFGADCGTGKSSSITEALKRWKEISFKGNGAIIFVSTLVEIDHFVNSAGLEKADYAVETGNKDYTHYGSGRHRANEVPVLFATHSKARRALRDAGSFAAASCFHYRGKPRALKVWDEALSPAICSSFRLDVLLALPRDFKGLPKAQRDILFNLSHPSIPFKDRPVLDIPNAAQGIADAVLRGDYKGQADEKATLEAVAKLAGSKAHLRGDGGTDSSFVGVGIPLPADIAPIIVLDASARLTGRYNDWSPYGMNVVQLKPVTLNYGNLKVHWWSRAAGKTELRKREELSTVFRGVADLINGAADQRFLIVLAKEFCAFDKEDRAILPNVLAEVINDPSRVAMINWGRHVGVNDFRDVPNVIIIGSHDYERTAYDALALGVSRNDEGVVTTGEWKAQKDAEFMSNLYQAVCRGTARNPVGSECGHGNAYLIMAETDHRRRLVERAFPGCAITSWEPIPKVRQSKAQEVATVVTAMIEARSKVMTAPFVSFRDVIEAFGSKQRSFLTKIVKRQWFIDTLAGKNIAIGKRHFVRSSAGTLAA